MALTVTDTGDRHAYALAYWPAVQEARAATPSACTNYYHDHTTTVGTVRYTLNGVAWADEITYPEDVPLRCNDCGAPTHYDDGVEFYIHDDPDLEECFLTMPPDAPGATPCTLPDRRHDTMTATTGPTCRERVSNGSRSMSFHTCGRPVKDEDLCGLHLAAKRRREANDQAYADNRTRQHQLRDASERRVADLAARGVTAHVEFAFNFGGRGGGMYTGGVVLRGSAADALIEALPLDL